MVCYENVTNVANFFLGSKSVLQNDAVSKKKALWRNPSRFYDDTVLDATQFLNHLTHSKVKTTKSKEGNPRTLTCWRTQRSKPMQLKTQPSPQNVDLPQQSSSLYYDGSFANGIKSHSVKSSFSNVRMKNQNKLKFKRCTL